MPMRTARPAEVEMEGDLGLGLGFGFGVGMGWVGVVLLMVVVDVVLGGGMGKVVGGPNWVCGVWAGL